MPKLICITGLDGVGKSTLIKYLNEAFPRAKTANIWDVMEAGVQTLPFKSKGDIDAYLCELTPDSRLLFLAHALKFSVDNALSSSSEMIILNGYIYKYFATELALGANENLVDSLSSSFPIPDLVIKLEMGVQAAAKRKDRLSRYECGIRPSTPENFVEFQKTVEPMWKYFDRQNWESISAELTKEEVFKEAMRIINMRLS